ncbi:3-methyl-2-oxobutanoate hydroxymethyltransferase [BD1-7 clade bacterium]|uniref:3-methyl-2-oxobutanoate hydroxymethyltransferase n=1 Tax=BD1-7 clade bacterium TaxID=2029982 RepID=A0A5S9MRG1_9GAMM|nr:3-methyl-2-oxobutanoate hydroxymethyltransferase [BD1-7 clade bacterium]CAA0085116.1 3-methyl-2-oxobutanoate hydroxymethyltransferase [BD1-7 clade bacterium]
MKNVTINTLQRNKISQEKFSVIAAYDATFSRLINQAGVDMILVGDSLGMVLQGHGTTVPVTIDDMCYHTAGVARGNTHTMIMADMPFMTYSDTASAVSNATRLMQAGAHMVKLEGGQWLCETISTLVCGGIPVCAHIGLTPQTVNTLGGYRVAGRGEHQAQQLIDDAVALEQAGAQIILMECVPSDVARRVDEAVSVPTIGIGAGVHTTAQVLVLHDLLGLNPQPARFVRNFMDGTDSIQGALRAYDEAVKDGSFPEEKHTFE